MSDLRILVGDDHKVIFDGIQSMLENTISVDELQYAASIAQIREALSRDRFDLLVLDLNINGINSLEHISDFLALSAQTKILVFTSYGNKKFIIKAKEAGALGYLVKNTDQQEFCGVVNKILAGGTDFPQKVTADYKSQIDHVLRVNMLEGVSERENQIISLVQEGNSDQEIADILFISYNTVRTHKKNIFKKLVVSGNNGLIKLLYQKNMEF
jgi:DNA-binding NarL/FixJ family response regulator